MREIEARILNVKEKDFISYRQSESWEFDSYITYHWGSIRIQDDKAIKKFKLNYDDIDGIRVSIGREIDVDNFKPIGNPTLIREIERSYRKKDVYVISLSRVKNIKGKDKPTITYEVEVELTGDFNEENMNKVIDEAIRIRDSISSYTKDDSTLFKEINSILGYDLKFTLNKPIQIKYDDITDKLLSYGMTIKVDGVRHFLYLNESGAYLIGTEIKKISDDRYDRTLYDVEVVRNKMYIIDMIILNGNSISSLTLKERYELFKEIDVKEYSVIKKEFKFPTKPAQYFRDLESLIDIQDMTSPYQVDGIIFTPNARYGYPNTIKWKPYKKLTIDVRLRDDNMYVYDTRKKEEVIFKADDADISNLKRIRNLNGQIIELNYNPEDNKFHLYKVRHDVSVPNDLKTALQIWRQLKNPITEDDMLSSNLTLMRKYHNRIKYSIYNLLRDLDKKTVLDIGSGKGGDILKWKTNDLDVVSVEPDEENYEEFKERMKIYKYNTKLLEMDMEYYHNNYKDKYKALTFFNSITFFTPEQIRSYTEHLYDDSLLIVLGMDKERLLDVFKSDVDRDNYLIEYRGNKVFIKIKDSIVRGQEENIFDFDELKNILSEYEVLNDFYLDDERLMSKEARDLSKCYRCTIYWKLPTRIVRRISQLHMNEIRPLKYNMFGDNAVRIGTLGDGSCFFHSILTAIDDSYLSMSSSEKKKRVKEFRYDLSSLFTKEAYLQLANGNIASLGETVHEYSYERMLMKLRDVRVWVGNEFLDFICKSLYLNIYIVSDRDWDLYRQGLDVDDVYNDKRPSIIILWQGGVHYELLGIFNTIDNKIQVLFEHDNQISQILYHRS